MEEKECSLRFFYVITYFHSLGWLICFHRLKALARIKIGKVLKWNERGEYFNLLLVAVICTLHYLISIDYNLLRIGYVCKHIMGFFDFYSIKISQLILNSVRILFPLIADFCSEKRRHDTIILAHNGQFDWLRQ